MDLVTHLPWISQEHDLVWVIVDQLTKSAPLPVVQITFALEEFCWSYIYMCVRGIVRIHGESVSVVLDRDFRFMAHY